jgi:hypothetical protein
MKMLVKAAIASSAVSMLVLATAGQAVAADRWTYRSTNTSASTTWIEFGSLPGGVLGNAHVGFLEVYSSGSNAEVYGKVRDWTCPEGELPPEGGGGHGEFEEEPPPTNCELHSERFIYAYGDEVAFSMDRKLGSATLTGVLNVEDHATGSGGQPPVNITWTGIGDMATYSNSGKYTEGGSTTYWKESGTSRQAVIADGSFIGAMGFTDDADDVSDGYMSTSKIYERSSSR